MEQAGNCLAAQIGITAASNTLALTTGELQGFSLLFKPRSSQSGRYRSCRQN
jgi:hypothetical protein